MFVKEVFQGRETMGVWVVGVEGSDTNSRHDGVVGRGMGRDRLISGIWLVSLMKRGGI